MRIEDKHIWLFDQAAGFFFCADCKVEVSQGLLTLELDDDHNIETKDLLDKLVDVECENNG